MAAFNDNRSQKGGYSSAPIVVPYDFVPLSSWIFTPDWAEDVSSDVPFEDGLSGRIDYELENFSPLCVGHKVSPGEDGGDKKLSWERDAADRFVIPGSSIKGMLRTALEIVSFGRMKHFDSRKHAFRMSISQVKGPGSQFQLLPILVRRSSANAGKWEFFKTHTEKDMTPGCATVSAAFLQNYLELKKSSSAKEKYERLIAKYREEQDTGRKLMPLVYAQLVEKRSTATDQNGDSRIVRWREVVSISRTQDKDHKYPGMFLFMNENIANKQSTKANKFTDYFFYADSEDDLKDQTRWKSIDEKLLAELCDSLPPMKADSGGVKADNLYNYVLNCMNRNYGFPVWYLKSKKEGDSALGFCQIMRKVGKKSVGDMISDINDLYYDKTGYETLREAPDLPDILFGSAMDDDSRSYGSRVGFSDLRSVTSCKTLYETYILGEPKPTFYAKYLGKFKFQKPYEEESIISGRKVYKIRSDLRLADPVYPNDNTDVRTCIEFVEPENVFKGSIVFHNLRPEELGALLWIMTFGSGNDSSGGCYHLLGHAKPMGAGAVRFRLSPDAVNLPYYLLDGDKVTGLSCGRDRLVAECIDRFERCMGEAYPFHRDGKNVDLVRMWKTSKPMVVYLKLSKVDNAATASKVYNAFPDEFKNIKSACQSKNGGYCPVGNKDSNACLTLAAEDGYKVADIEARKAEQRALLEAKKREEEEKLAKQKETEERERREHEEKENRLSSWKNQVREQFDAEKEPYALSLLVLMDPDLKPSLESRVAAGDVPEIWSSLSTINQICKQITRDLPDADADRLKPVADRIYQLCTLAESGGGEREKFSLAVEQYVGGKPGKNKKAKEKSALAKALLEQKPSA